MSSALNDFVVSKGVVSTLYSVLYRLSVLFEVFEKMGQEASDQELFDMVRPNPRVKARLKAGL